MGLKKVLLVILIGFILISCKTEYEEGVKKEVDVTLVNTDVIQFFCINGVTYFRIYTGTELLPLIDEYNILVSCSELKEKRGNEDGFKDYNW